MGLALGGRWGGRERETSEKAVCVVRLGIIRKSRNMSRYIILSLWKHSRGSRPLAFRSKSLLLCGSAVLTCKADCRWVMKLHWQDRRSPSGSVGPRQHKQRARDEKALCPSRELKDSHRSWNQGGRARPEGTYGVIWRPTKGPWLTWLRPVWLKSLRSQPLSAPNADKVFKGEEKWMTLHEWASEVTYVLGWSMFSLQASNQVWKLT